MRAVGNVTKDNRTNSTSFYLPIYEKVPEFEISIDEIVTFAWIRYRFHEELRSLTEAAEINDEHKKVQPLFTKYNLLYSNILSSNHRNGNVVPDTILDNYKPIEIDVNEFFSLLIISLKNEDYQKSFIQGEAAIFRHRLTSYASIKLSDIPSQIRDMAKIDFDSYLQGDSFKIPFELIFPYIDVTRCKLKDGYVTLSFKDMISIFVSSYKMYLEKKFAVLKKQNIHETEFFKVITQMFDEQNGAFMPKERTNWNVVTLDDVDNIAHRSFPPCMYNMYMKLKTSHKLFYTGRLQLGLFLKGIGLSLNDSLKLWRDEFSKFGITLDQFDRQYAYNIRYNYGKEGSCRNFSPYSCLGMIRMPAPAIGQTHGCPFMQMKKEDCKLILKRMFNDSKKKHGVASDDRCEAIAEKGQKHAQIACVQLFNELHDRPYEEPAIRHPCEYFSASEEQFKEKESSK